MGGEGKLRIEKFDGKDFMYWMMQIEDYLYQRKLYRPLKGVKPDDMTDDQWLEMDRMALSVVRLSLTRSVALACAAEKTTMGLISKLKGMYEKPSASNQVYLIRKLFNLVLKEGDSVTEHINMFTAMIGQLSSINIVFEDKLQALTLLSSLPDSWVGLITSVSSAMSKEELKLEDVKDLLLGEELRRKNSSQQGGSSSVLLAESSGRGRSYSKSDRKGNRSKSRGANRARNAICWNCDSKGHFKRDCKAPLKKKKGKEKEYETLGSCSENSDEEVLICCVDSEVESWVLDSGASFHSTFQKEQLKNYYSTELKKVYLADGSALDVLGRGEVHIKTNLGLWILKDVRYILGLSRQLISVSQLDKEGYHAIFANNSWKIAKGIRIVAKGSKTGTLYLVPSETDNVIAAVTKGEDSTLWHRRMGHISERGLKKLQAVGKFPKLNSVSLEVCEDCIFGKQKAVKFSKQKKVPKEQNLELVHSNVWGPASVESLGGARYFVTFIDDHSRKLLVYYLKHKSEVFATFKKWKLEVENQSGRKIKCLLSDNGGEYESTEFKLFCEEMGIRRQRTVAGTPQQNGTAERMNQTLCNRARSMLVHSGLPKSFWAEAVTTAAYLINMCPSVPLDFKIPQEVWSGKEANLSHLKVFGCAAYVLLPKEKRDKLDPKSVKTYFLGYGRNQYGYRCWNPETKEVVRAKNVVFVETDLYKHRQGTSKEVGKMVTLGTQIWQNEEVQGNSTETAAEEEFFEEPEAEDRTNVEDAENREIPSADENVEVEGDTSHYVRRSTRVSRPPMRLDPSPVVNFLLLTNAGEPESYNEALKHGDAVKWEHAIKEELKFLAENQTWKLAVLPEGKKALHNKWVFRVKEEADGKKRFKARLVVKGFQQLQNIDYSEVFSPVVKMTTIRTLLAIVAAQNLFLEQMDVRTAFLHGELEEDIYMYRPKGSYIKDKKLVCKLQKSLYGLKRAPRQWYKRFDTFLCSINFKRADSDHCCYQRRSGKVSVILGIYVDDMLIASSSIKEIKLLKSQLSKEFDMKDLGKAKQILGMRISRSAGCIKLSQKKYLQKVLDRFKCANVRRTDLPLGAEFKLSKEDSPKTTEEEERMKNVPYASTVGSLMYAMICTRPDIAHAVGVVSRFMSKPGEEHWRAVKWILRYLQNTLDIGLCFTQEAVVLEGYCDSDLGGDLDTSRSTSGYIFCIGGTTVSWRSKLQGHVSLSTTEAEYVAATEATKEKIWLENLLTKLGFVQKKSVLHCDSQSAIYLAKNPKFHSKSKHIRHKYHFIRELIEKGELELRKISGDQNAADMLTKIMSIAKLRLCMALVNLRDH